MTHSHSIAPIPIVAAYFARFGITETPIITEEFTPGKAWRRSGWRKRISRSWAQKLAHEGITHVQLSAGTHHADFGIEEIMRSY